MTQDEEDRQLRSVLGALGVVAQWERLTGGSGPSAPADDSDLAADDARVHPHQVSHAAWAAISAAVSHLGCLRDSLFTQTGPAAFNARLHTHGQFTLVRGALENASHAVWLLESDDREVRRLRRIQQEWAESRQLDEVIREIDGRAEGKTPRFTRLSPVARRAGVEPDEIKKTPDYTTIMRAAGRYIAAGPAVTVVIWKACSSLAHGEARGQLVYLTKEVVGESSPGVALARVTSNVLLLTAGAGAAIAMTKTALDFYDRRSGAPAR